VIYSQRRTPFEAPAEWRLEDGVLVLSGKAPRAFPLSDLRSARLIPSARRQGLKTVTLRLAFRKGVAAVGSHGFGPKLAYLDQTSAFAPFVRALLLEAQHQAPSARYQVGSERTRGVFFGAGAILAAGLVLVLMAAIAAGELTLGLEMAARLSFVLIVMLAIWPWLSGLNVRRFDPGAPPPELLP
jgi:hypothetical protein